MSMDVNQWHIWLCNGTETYGVAESIRLLAREVALTRNVLLVCVQEGKFEARMRAEGHLVVVLGDTPIPVPAGSGAQKVAAWIGGQVVSVGLARRMARLVAQPQDAVIHVIWPTLLPTAAAIAQQWGARLYWHVHNNVGAYPFHLNVRASRRQLKRSGGRALPCSSSVAEQFRGLIKTTILPLAADSKRFFPAVRDEQLILSLGLDPTKPVAGCVARLDPSKGQALLITAASKIQGGDLQLLIVGGKPSEAGHLADLQRLASRLSVKAVFVPATDKPEMYYPSIDFSVNARIDNEPFGLSVVESMLCARPVVAFANGGPKDILAKGGGWLVSGEANEANLSRTIELALGESARWREIGVQGRASALSSYTPAVLASRLYALP
jgi:glycosyltransferase involved in cell wall biosynthesis